MTAFRHHLPAYGVRTRWDETIIVYIYISCWYNNIIQSHSEVRCFSSESNIVCGNSSSTNNIQNPNSHIVSISNVSSSLTVLNIAINTAIVQRYMNLNQLYLIVSDIICQIGCHSNLVIIWGSYWVEFTTSVCIWLGQTHSHRHDPIIKA